MNYEFCEFKKKTGLYLVARKMFPSLDEPTYKSTFDLTIGHATSMTALSNMPIKSSRLM